MKSRTVRGGPTAAQPGGSGNGGKPPSILETVILYYCSHEPVSGYEICRLMKSDGLREFFPYTEAAVYRAVQRLSLRGCLAAQAVRQSGRQSTVYRMNANGCGSLQQGVRHHLSRFALDPAARIVMALLYYTPSQTILDTVLQVYEDVKLRYNTVKHNLENYRGGRRIGTWALLGYEERRLTMELLWLRDMAEALRKRLADGQATGFAGMPKQPWVSF